MFGLLKKGRRWTQLAYNTVLDNDDGDEEEEEEEAEKKE
jgi:hypothetical protein